MRKRDNLNLDWKTKIGQDVYIKLASRGYVTLKQRSERDRSRKTAPNRSMEVTANAHFVLDKN